MSKSPSKITVIKAISNDNHACREMDVASAPLENFVCNGPVTCSLIKNHAHLAEAATGYGPANSGPMSAPSPSHRDCREGSLIPWVRVGRHSDDLGGQEGSEGSGPGGLRMWSYVSCFHV